MLLQDNQSYLGEKRIVGIKKVWLLSLLSSWSVSAQFQLSTIDKIPCTRHSYLIEPGTVSVARLESFSLMAFSGHGCWSIQCVCVCVACQLLRSRILWSNTPEAFYLLEYRHRKKLFNLNTNKSASISINLSTHIDPVITEMRVVVHKGSWYLVESQREAVDCY